MSAEEFLDKSAFDGIIASLESLLSEVQGLVDSLDPLNDTQVIADFQALADSLAELISVAGNLPEINSVEENLTAINAVNDALANVNTAATNIANINTVAGNDENITILAGLDTEISGLGGIITEIQTTAANIQPIIDAPVFAQAAEDARDKAEQWADEDEDVPVETTPDRFSSKHWAIKSDDSAQISLGVANFAGRWEDLTGALNVPSTVFHEDQLWLLLEDLADVTTSEPDSENTDWRLLNLTQITQSLQASVDEYPFAGWTVGGGESSIDISHEGEILVYRNGSLLDENSWGLIGTVLTISFELTTDDIVTVLKLSEVVGLSQINDQDEETDPDSTDNLVAQKTDGSIVRVAWGAIKTWLQSNFATGDHSDVEITDVQEGDLLVRNGDGKFVNSTKNLIHPPAKYNADIISNRIFVYDDGVGEDQNPITNTKSGHQWITWEGNGFRRVDQRLRCATSIKTINVINYEQPSDGFDSNTNQSRQIDGILRGGRTSDRYSGFIIGHDSDNYFYSRVTNSTIEIWRVIDGVENHVATKNVASANSLFERDVYCFFSFLKSSTGSGITRLIFSIPTIEGATLFSDLSSYNEDLPTSDYIGIASNNTLACITTFRVTEIN